ncbi:hypothetical protein CYMTET_2549 [Cymbomonas tetramitiformis]|uniref:Uncharacterized protein n=1 Tax=Cymbomonas tetramitiformis TaxID=36881 RepID=A0AAE0H566_9CHLO|nr:hypothetical protein CYMTET_2549 [Cymbomonas tetramitiformis]
MTTTPTRLRTDFARLPSTRARDGGARLTKPERALLCRLMAVMPSDIRTAAKAEHGLDWSVIVTMFPSDPVGALLLENPQWNQSMNAEAADVMGITLDTLLDAGLRLRHLSALGWGFRRWNETFGISERFFEDIASSSTLRDRDLLTVGWSPDEARIALNQIPRYT